jgi:hypothetical protein
MTMYGETGEHQDLRSPCLAGLSGPNELSFAHPDTPQILMLSFDTPFPVLPTEADHSPAGFYPASQSRRDG